jgi:hypothetical protein
LLDYFLLGITNTISHYENLFRSSAIRLLEGQTGVPNNLLEDLLMILHLLRVTPVLTEVAVHRGIHGQCLHVALTVHVVSNHHSRVFEQIQVVSLDAPRDGTQFRLVLDQDLAANTPQVLPSSDSVCQDNLACNWHVLRENLLQLLVQRGCVLFALQDQDSSTYRAWFNILLELLTPVLEVVWSPSNLKVIGLSPFEFHIRACILELIIE